MRDRDFKAPRRHTSSLRARYLYTVLCWRLSFHHLYYAQRRAIQQTCMRPSIKLCRSFHTKDEKRAHYGICQRVDENNNLL
jgi:hypothetical protein